MSAPPFGGVFPGTPAAAQAPGAQPQQQAPAFVLIIPADPDWQPMEMTDTLEKDGYFSARIKSEKARTAANEKAGVWLTLELLDQDVGGKQLSKFMIDPRATTKDSWWTWRTLLRSVTGSTQGGQAGMTYTPGVLTGQVVYIKTGMYLDEGGGARTGVDAFVTKDVWEEATKSGRHRWDAKPRTAGNAAGHVGALPGQTGGAFPGLAAGGGLPGLPAANPMQMTPPSAPQPAAAAPMAQAPQAPAAPAFQQPAAPAPATPTFQQPAAPAPAFQQAPAPAFGFQQPPAPGGAPAPAFGFPAATAPAQAPQAPAPGSATGFPPFPGMGS